MNYITGYRCTICGKIFKPGEVELTCPICGEKGILDVEYDYEALKKVLTKEYFAKNTNYSMWRYAPLMGIKEDHIDEMLRIGWTPLVKSHNLAKELGLKELYIKDDGLNPSGSSKDRASGVAVLKAIEAGAKVISCSSTGNAASSCACHAAHMGLPAVIFVPKRAPIGKLTQISLYGATLVVVDGDYKAAFKLSKEAINRHHWYNRNAAINPFMVEGKKTVSLEIAEQLKFKPTDWVVASVGDGCTIGGVYKGFDELHKLGLIDRVPRILGVQSTGCEPFVVASRNNEPLKECEENTIADSIAVGIPRNPLKALRAVSKSNGRWISVSDEKILEAMGELGRKEGIFGEPAGVTCLAGLKEALNQGIIQKDESVTIIITGNGLKDPANAQKAIEKPPLMEADINKLDIYLKEKGVI